MITVAFRSVWAYRRRLVGTTLAVVLGVAFLSGTFLLSDTLRSNFNRLFTRADRGTDVVVRSTTQVTSDQRQNRRATVDAALLATVRATPGVAEADPYIEGYGRLLGRDGKPVGRIGPPTRAANWVADPSLNPYRLSEGRAPRADDEVVINRGAAKAGGLHLGDTTTVLVPAPLRVKIVGIATFGTADGFGPSTFTGMTLGTAERYLADGQPRLTEILVKADPAHPADALAGEVQARLPSGVQAITGAQLSGEDIADINSGFLGFVRNGLLVFALIALLVASFSIYNTFSIVSAQRRREAALLRALGATQRQVFASTALETIAVGLAGSAVGWGAGMGLAVLLKAAFAGFGFALPAGGLTVSATSALVAIGAGVGATVIAGLAPAWHQGRVAPVEALTETMMETRRPSRLRAAVGTALTVGGALALVLAALGATTVALAVAGAALTTAGTVVLGPIVARPVAAALGAAAAATSYTGHLSRDNATRSPRRTAAAASALMVGVAVVTIFTVVASSLKASAAAAVDRSLTADLVVTGTGLGAATGGRFSPAMAPAIASVTGVRAAVGLGAGSAIIDGQSHAVTVADTTLLADVVDAGATAGSLNSVGSSAIGVSHDAARRAHLTVGTPVSMTFPDGATTHLSVAAVYGRADVLGDYLVSPRLWATHSTQPIDDRVLIALSPGANVRATSAVIDRVAAAYGAPPVLDRAQYRNAAAGSVDTILGLVYVLLVLAIVIALMGIANSLSLSIHERRRELGLLRAVGQTRAQTRRMVRWESVIISLFGTSGGIALGAFIGWAIVKAASASITVFAFPAAPVAAFVALGALSGMLAAVRPARRAARLDVLQAIAAP
jgi:putative ABC transport system permease protein